MFPVTGPREVAKTLRRRKSLVFRHILFAA
jgi:hypothetical protein